MKVSTIYVLGALAIAGAALHVRNTTHHVWNWTYKRLNPEAAVSVYRGPIPAGGLDFEIGKGRPYMLTFDGDIDERQLQGRLHLDAITETKGAEPPNGAAVALAPVPDSRGFEPGVDAPPAFRADDVILEPDTEPIEPEPQKPKRPKLRAPSPKNPVYLGTFNDMERVYASSEEKLKDLMNDLDSGVCIPWGEKIYGRRFDPDKDYELGCGNFDEGMAVFWAEGKTETRSLSDKEMRAFLKAMHLEDYAERETPLQLRYKGRIVTVYNDKVTMTPFYLITIPDMGEYALDQIPENISGLSNELVIKAPERRDSDGKLFVTGYQEPWGLRITARGGHLKIRTTGYHPIELSDKEQERRLIKNDSTITVSPN